MQNDMKGAFLNRRDWHSYLHTLQASATYPKMMDALKSGQAWITAGALQASTWLAEGGQLPPLSGKLTTG